MSEEKNDGGETRIPPALSYEIQKSLRDREVDLASQIAFLENGLSVYKSEIALCKRYEITLEYLEECKARLRNEIEKFKEQHRYARYRVVQATAGRLNLYKALEEAAVAGDQAQVEIIAKAISILDKSAPISKLKDLNEILSNVQSPEEAQRAVDNSQTFIFSQQITKADELLAARKKKAIELEGNT
jgi:hypothetical protein